MSRWWRATPIEGRRRTSIHRSSGVRQEPPPRAVGSVQHEAYLCEGHASGARTFSTGRAQAGRRQSVLGIVVFERGETERRRSVGNCNRNRSECNARATFPGTAALPHRGVLEAALGRRGRQTPGPSSVRRMQTVIFMPTGEGFFAAFLLGSAPGTGDDVEDHVASRDTGAPTRSLPHDVLHGRRTGASGPSWAGCAGRQDRGVLERPRHPDLPLSESATAVYAAVGFAPS